MKESLLFQASSYAKRAGLIFNLSLLLIATGISTVSSAQGSGNTLAFNGSQHVTLGSLSITGSYTKEAWVYWTGTGLPGDFNNILSGQNSAFWINNGLLSAGHNNNFVEIQEAVPFVGSVWTHVAVTYNVGTNQLNLYKNGILVAGPVTSLSVGLTDPVQQIGAYFDGATYLAKWSGNIDEVRLWNRVLTQTEIRDGMCKKLSPPVTNLVSYYRLDASSGSTVTDAAGANNGTVVGTANWVVSGAAIGDASAHDYVNVTKSASLTHAGTGEVFTATSTSGAPAGIHVYRVDAVPSSTTGIVGLGTNNKYFGVFQAGGVTPQYTAVYNYNNTIPGPAETDIRLYKRANNSVAAWTVTAATQNTGANTLTLAGESTEYILGSAGFALPVNFESFVASREATGVQLSWKTAQETDNKGFEIQRSTGNNDWTNIGFVAADPNGGNGSTYSFTDARPTKGTNYYRLRQEDLNGRSKFSDVRWVINPSFVNIAVYPVPAKTAITIDINKAELLNTNVQLVDMQGKILKQIRLVKVQQSVSVEELRPGNYLLRFNDGSVQKIIKQ